MPEEKIARLKDYIQSTIVFIIVHGICTFDMTMKTTLYELFNISDNSKAEDIASIKQAVSARDCLRYLRDAKRFTSSDVMFVQYLFKKIDCGEQYEKCYKYAEKQDALCFYEKPPGNIFFSHKYFSFSIKILKFQEAMEGAFKSQI